MAIDDLLDEHEQSERVRSWLRKNGLSILGGVAVAVGAIWGWGYWQQSHGDKLASANLEYQKVLKGIEENKLDEAGKAVKALDAGPSNIYSELAALQLAKAQVEAGKNDDALATLRAVSVEGDLKHVVDQRIARLLVATGKGDEAIKLLGSATDSSALEIHGDALMAAGKRDEARGQYEKALKTLDVAAPQRRLLETKLMDAGGTVAATEETV
ncbi:tetratricopeptide repeat protein [Stenotrophomonas sp. 169]|uniref:YfgM family protein n=1 Tax=unclassified Stenotrophomonas TaxID=196198 RepID=UPI0016621CCC|nr:MULTISPECIES: tetratricopeptide repeat protein [unclassified Stenotrophomonas]MBD8635360.1 tetratricopeptide repeat protein [Stenotrophomonas sp. CFBP 13725]QNR96039.1 tetratricopeptide repeat protein [Stenotrophomonas sp. 169]